MSMTENFFADYGGKHPPARTDLIIGAFLALGTPEMGIRNVPRLLGECCWTLLGDNTWEASRHRISRLIRLPPSGSP